MDYEPIEGYGTDKSTASARDRLVRRAVAQTKAESEHARELSELRRTLRRAGDEALESARREHAAEMTNLRMQHRLALSAESRTFENSMRSKFAENITKQSLPRFAVFAISVAS